MISTCHLFQILSQSRSTKRQQACGSGRQPGEVLEQRLLLAGADVSGDSVAPNSELPGGYSTSIIGYRNQDPHGYWMTLKPEFLPGTNTYTGEYKIDILAGGESWEIREVHHGDFNGDGRLDVAVWLESGEWLIGLAEINQGGFVDGRSSDGDLTFTSWTTWRTTGIKEVHVGDFNNDGRDDIIGLFQNGESGSWWVATSEGNRFANRYWGSYGKYDGIADVLVGNFDGVKGDDLAIIAKTGVVWLAKTSNFQFQNMYSHTWDLSSGLSFSATGDFNADGREDIVVALAGMNDRIDLYVAQSSGPANGFDNRNDAAVIIGAGLQSFDSLVVGNFDGDPEDEVAIRFNSTEWWVGQASDSGLGFRFWTSWPFAANGMTNVHVGNTNGYGYDDIIGQDSDGNWFSAESTGTRFHNRVIRKRAPMNWEFVQTGEFYRPLFAVADSSHPVLADEADFGSPMLLDQLSSL